MTTVRWISRAQCGLATPNPARLTKRTDQVWGVTKHHTGGNRPRSASESMGQWRALQAAAMSGANVNHTRYGDIEYNVGFDDFGQILVGRGNEWVGAHATSRNNVANRQTFGAVYLGSGDPSPAAMQAFHAYCYVAGFTLGHAPLTLGHLDWVKWGGIPTACPGRLLEQSRP
jgi:hypothetical protein